MRLMFVSGKYLGGSKDLTMFNTVMAEKVAVKCWKKGWAVLCPHMNTFGFEDHDALSWERFDIGEGMVSDSNDIFYSAYLEMLSRCDAIIMVENWLNSRGARAEHQWARLNGIPIFYASERIPHPSEVGVRVR